MFPVRRHACTVLRFDGSRKTWCWKLDQPDHVTKTDSTRFSNNGHIGNQYQYRVLDRDIPTFFLTKSYWDYSHLAEMCCRDWRVSARTLKWCEEVRMCIRQGSGCRSKWPGSAAALCVCLFRNKETNRDEFIFYSKRLMRLLIEHALSFLPLKVSFSSEHRSRASSLIRF